MSRIPKIFLFLSLPLFVLDQVTKWWVVFKFHEPIEGDFATPDPSVPVIDGVLWWWRVHNQGVAFGLGNGTAWAPLVFSLVLVLALVIIVVSWRKGAFVNAPARLAAALLFAGVCGNFTDRLLQGFFLEEHKDKSLMQRLSKGYVVDFIRVKIPGYEKLSPRSGGFFPTFNVADSCISVAASLLFLSAFRPEEVEKKDDELV